MSIARRIFKPSFLRVDKNLNGIDKKAAELKCLGVAVEKSTSNFGSSLLDVSDVDYGFKFEEHIAEMRQKGEKINENELSNLKFKCRAFLRRLTEEFVKRLPVLILHSKFIISCQ